MGLFSATAIVMGSMIGSGIFIVSADMRRALGSPALLIAAWLVTAAMTIIGALSYGELAAMMPKAGGQYVYLREALGPLWGFLYGWTLFLVIQTGTIAAVGVAFGKFLGVFFPSVSADWIWHIGHVLACGPMVLGNMIGLNTANLAAIVVITLLTLAEYARREAGRGGAECVYVCEGAGAAGGGAGGGGGEELRRRSRRTLVRAGITSGRVPGGTRCMRCRWVWVGRRRMVGLLTVVAVVQVGSLFSSDAWNNVTFTAGEIQESEAESAAVAGAWNGRCAAAVCRCATLFI